MLLSDACNKGCRTVTGKRRWTSALGLAAGVAALALGSAVAVLYSELPVLRSLADYAPPEASQVFSEDGVEVGSFYNERRRVVPFAQIPPHVVHAFLAAEDAGFYAHEGIDYWG
ncbi:MAG: penicillin-binding protein, partial [Deltaproteobacteria bacterium]